METSLSLLKNRVDNGGVDRIVVLRERDLDLLAELQLFDNRLVFAKMAEVVNGKSHFDRGATGPGGAGANAFRLAFVDGARRGSEL